MFGFDKDWEDAHLLGRERRLAREARENARQERWREIREAREAWKAAEQRRLRGETDPVTISGCVGKAIGLIISIAILLAFFGVWHPAAFFKALFEH